MAQIIQPVKISKQSIFLTVVSLCIITGLMLLNVHQGDVIKVYILAGLIVGICGFALWYAPQAIEVDSSSLKIRRALRTKTIPLEQIRSVQPWAPGTEYHKVCASGGWFGYWGWFSSKAVGKFFGYFGESDRCFMVTLADGRHYLLGCADCAPIVDFINNHTSTK